MNIVNAFIRFWADRDVEIKHLSAHSIVVFFIETVILSTGFRVRGGPPSLISAVLVVVYGLLLKLQLSFLNDFWMMLVEMMEVLLLMIVVLLLLLLLHGYRDVMLLSSFPVWWRRCDRSRCRVRGYRRRSFRQRHAHVAHLQSLTSQPILGQRLGRVPRRPTSAKHEIRVFCATLHFHLM